MDAAARTTILNGTWRACPPTLRAIGAPHPPMCRHYFAAVYNITNCFELVRVYNCT